MDRFTVVAELEHRVVPLHLVLLAEAARVDMLMPSLLVLRQRTLILSARKEPLLATTEQVAGMEEMAATV